MLLLLISLPSAILTFKAITCDLFMLGAILSINDSVGVHTGQDGLWLVLSCTMPTTTNHLLHAYQDTQHTHTTHYWTHQTLHPTVQDSVNAVVGCRAVNTEHCTVQVKLEMGGMTGRRYDPLLSTDPDCTALYSTVYTSWFVIRNLSEYS